MKYIIDVPNQDYSYDEILHTLKLKFYDDNLSCEVLLDAESYTESDRKAIEDEVWEFARKMISTSGNEVSEMWGCATNFGEVMHNTTYSEAKSKFEAWLKKKDEIHVGDEVENASHKKGIVFNHYISPSNGVKWVRILCMDNDGNSFMTSWEENDVYKTGRHFDDVEELLKKIGSEE